MTSMPAPAWQAEPVIGMAEIVRAVHLGVIPSAAAEQERTQLAPGIIYASKLARTG